MDITNLSMVVVYKRILSLFPVCSCYLGTEECCNSKEEEGERSGESEKEVEICLKCCPHLCIKGVQSHFQTLPSMITSLPRPRAIFFCTLPRFSPLNTKKSKKNDFLLLLQLIPMLVSHSEFRADCSSWFLWLFLLWIPCLPHHIIFSPFHARILFHALVLQIGTWLIPRRSWAHLSPNNRPRLIHAAVIFWPTLTSLL